MLHMYTQCKLTCKPRKGLEPCLTFYPTYDWELAFHIYIEREFTGHITFYHAPLYTRANKTCQGNLDRVYGALSPINTIPDRFLCRHANLSGTVWANWAQNCSHECAAILEIASYGWRGNKCGKWITEFMLRLWYCIISDHKTYQQHPTHLL